MLVKNAASGAHYLLVLAQCAVCEARNVDGGKALKRNRAQPGRLRPSFLFFPAKARGLGGMGIDRIFFQCGDAVPGSRGLTQKESPTRPIGNSPWYLRAVRSGVRCFQATLPTRFNYCRNRPEGELLRMRYSGWGNSECWIGWAANPGRSQGATAEKANAVPERCPSILFLS
jgi:hypothetical protein